MGEQLNGIEVRYFAAAADAAGRDKETVDLPRGADLGALRAALLDRYGTDMRRVLSVAAYLVEPAGPGGSPSGVQGELTRDLTHPVGSRVDVLPPFAGG
ncbi:MULTISPECIES: MoaD/ThiS family protein [Rhodococcus]|uniref:MoaD/ThiS family protein n=1 Tax=Rhodococcus TaxID=1827 RepID=UPI001CF8A71E|nr:MULTISPECIES: MoaD/ThiS family protein [Rhodococcus]